MHLSKRSSRNYVNIRLEQVARTARDAADKVYRREFGIDILHIRILRIVAETRGRPVNWVVGESNLDRTLVSRMITNLVKRNLLERTIAPNDARQFLLFTTPTGDELVSRADVLGDALNRDLVSVLDQQELETFEACLAKLARWRPKE